MAADVLAKLTPPSWRGIPFPLTSLENGFTHEHVEHKFIYREGMHIETTGRNGFNFLGRIPFNNGVTAANFEPWAGRTLYPDLFNDFLNACLDGSTGEFVHPNFGPITCKARDITWRYTSAERDGAEISVRWYQTDDDIANGPTALNAGASPGASATDAAADLDDQLSQQQTTFPELANDGDSFSGLLQDYNDGSGNIGRINSKLDNTSAAIDRQDDVSLWPLRRATENMRSAVINLGGAPSGPSAVGVREYTVPFGTSVSQIGITLRIRTDSIVTMNPKLARDPYVPAGTRVRYRAG